MPTPPNFNRLWLQYWTTSVKRFMQDGITLDLASARDTICELGAIEDNLERASYYGIRRFGIWIATNNTLFRESSHTLHLCSCCRISLIGMDVLAATPEGTPTNLIPPHVYCSPLPNFVFIRNIWPLLVAPLRTVTASKLQTIQLLDVLFHLRCLNSQWKWLIETSTEWAAFRLA